MQILQRIFKSTIVLLFFLVATLYAQDQIEINYEDYNDQDIFNNFSGDWNIWQNQIASFNWSFDTTEYRGNYGASLKLNYSVPQGGFGGLWNSILGKIDFSNQHLDFTDLYGDLLNSDGNPTNIENVKIINFKFWAKGNSKGVFNHVVKIEFKDIMNNITFKTFEIPNMSDWTEYQFPISEIKNIDLKHLKQINFVISDFENENRSSYFFLDDLSFITTETSYNATQWSDDQFLDVIAHRAFKYFLSFTDDFGFALDKSIYSDVVSVGAIGFQLTAFCIGHQRKWAKDLEIKVENILSNLVSLPMGPELGTINAGYQGFFYHFLEANTGRRKDNDVELSLYDTMLLMYGVLTCKEYFSNNQNIQTYAQALYDSVQWSWMVDTSNGINQYQFRLGWKPETGFEGHVDGYTDEATLVDVLALGSTTFPTTMESYNARSRYFGTYPNDNQNSIAAAWTGSLFNYFFVGCWLDLEPRGVDKHNKYPINIWENNRRAVLANYKFCIDKQDDTVGDKDGMYTTYGDSSWGLTACDNLDDFKNTGSLSQYFAFGAMPTEQNIRFSIESPHIGTIAVYGAGSSIVYTPVESMKALKYYYSNTSLWSSLFGFGDAYSTDPHFFELDANNNPAIIHEASWLNGPWVNKTMVGINVGPMLLAIENYRSRLIWNLTNRNINICTGLNQIFTSTQVDRQLTNSLPSSYGLYQNYPNPFNSTTLIKYDLPRYSKVSLVIYNLLGEEIVQLVNENQSPGLKTVLWNGRDNWGNKKCSGIYFYRLSTNEYEKILKLVLIQ